MRDHPEVTPKNSGIASMLQANKKQQEMLMNHVLFAHHCIVYAYMENILLVLIIPLEMFSLLYSPLVAPWFSTTRQEWMEASGAEMMRRSRECVPQEPAELEPLWRFWALASPLGFDFWDGKQNQEANDSDEL